MRDDRFQGNGVCMVSQLRTALLLHSIKDRSDLISPEVRKLAFYDRKKDAQYCETLYWYLAYGRSLKKHVMHFIPIAIPCSTASERCRRIFPFH